MATPGYGGQAHDSRIVRKNKPQVPRAKGAGRPELQQARTLWEWAAGRSARRRGHENGNTAEGGCATQAHTAPKDAALTLRLGSG